MVFQKIGHSNSKPVYRKEEHAFIPHDSSELEKFDSYSADSVSSTAVQNANNPTIIEVSNVGGICQSVWLYMDIEIKTGVVIAAPMALWFDSIDFYADKGSMRVQTLYKESLWGNLNYIESEKFEQIGKLCNTTVRGGARDELAIDTYRFCMPLMGSYLEGLWLSKLPTDIQIRLNHIAGGILESGTSTYATLTGAGVYIYHTEPSPQEALEWNTALNNGYFEKIYLDNIRHFDPSLTMVGGTLTDRQLSGLNGKLGSLMICLRQGTGNSAKNERKFDFIGSNTSRGTINIVDSTGGSILGNTARDQDIIKADMSLHYDGLFHQTHDFYMLAFGDVKSHLNGEPIGYRQFDSSERLQINGGTATAETARVYTGILNSSVDVTTGTAADAGSYYFEVTVGDKTYRTAQFAFDATNTTIDAEFVRLFKEIPHVVITSARGADDATGVELTIANLKKEHLLVNGCVIRTISECEDGATSMIVRPVETTSGVPHDGLPSSTRNITIIGTKFKLIRIGKSKSDLMAYDL